MNLCEDCYHLQLTHIVNPDLLFKDYLYVSGTTKTLRDNFKWFADFAIENSYPWHRPKNVLDIACNDGSQLDCFKSKGILTYGIDPAENLYELSSKNHTVICDYFSADKFRDIVKILPRKHEYKKFDIILAQNVFAHNETAKKFLDDCEKLMHDDSKLYVQTSQSDMVRNDQTWSEMVSQKRSVMVRICQTLSDMVRNGQQWSEIVSDGHKLSDIVRNGQP